MRRLHYWLILAALAITAIEAPAAPPGDALTTEIAALAADFAKIIEKKGGGAVAVGEFSASSSIKGGVGPRLQLALIQSLQALGVQVDPDNYRFEIKGDYQDVIDKETDLLGVRLIGRLIDRETGDPLAEKPTGRFIFGTETVPGMLGLNASGPPTQDATELSNRFKEAKANPQARIEGDTLRGLTGHYAIEVLVKRSAEYVACGIQPDGKKRPIVALMPGDTYGVRLVNNSPHEAAVDLQIDGVNCFAFSNEKSRYWVIAPGASLDVLGWHKDNQTTIEYKVVGEFAETAAAKLNLKPSASIGLITASFSACWSDESRRPADEKSLETRGTGFGAEINLKTQQVTRTIGQPRDTLSIRYER